MTTYTEEGCPFKDDCSDPDHRHTKTPSLDELLDAHATTYAWAASQYVTHKITEEERDKKWHHSDLTAKHAIQAFIANEVREIIGLDNATVRNGLVGLTHRDENRNELRAEQHQRAKEKGYEI